LAYRAQDREEFTWFKKRRRGHRNSDFLQLGPNPPLHGDIFPGSQTSRILVNKLHEKGLLAKLPAKTNTDLRDGNKKLHSTLEPSSEPINNIKEEEVNINHGSSVDLMHYLSNYDLILMNKQSKT
jgi:hypothetical protein